MPARTRWLPELKTMVVSHHGTVTPEDLYATDQAALGQCEGHGEGIRYAADFRGCELAMTKQDALEHARQMNELDFWHRIPGLRVAMITENPRDTALGLLFNTEAVDARMHIFSTVEGAWAYLGLDPSTLDQIADLVPRTTGGDD